MTTTLQITPNHGPHLVAELVTQHFDMTGQVRSETVLLLELGKTHTAYVSDSAQATVRERLVDSNAGTSTVTGTEAGMNAVPVTFGQALQALVGQAIASGDSVADIVASLEAERKGAAALID